MTIATDRRKKSGSQSYETELGKYNELGIGGERQLPHEQILLQTLEKLGNKRLAKRRKEAQRLLRENGATHNLFGPADTTRDWQFDPIPLVIGSEEWSLVEQGLVQRAELLNLILADIYGPRKLIENGLLPPEAVFTHKGFLWPCVGLLPPGGRHLNFYSANIARAKDGRFWVLDDHSTPPFGSGYALENRVVMTRSFPRLYQDFQVHRLAMFFRALRNRLTLLAKDQSNRATHRGPYPRPGACPLF